jgi:hypothetical protein
MATRNDITGDALITKVANENYRNNYDLIFGKKNKKSADVTLTDEGNKELANTQLVSDLNTLSSD